MFLTTVKTKIENKVRLTVEKFIYLCKHSPRTLLTWLAAYITMTIITSLLVSLTGLSIWLTVFAMLMFLGWHIFLMYRLTKTPEQRLREKSTKN